ncbi:MAG: hypothetical protein CMM76_07100 [Rhodospirillaceae bacterium]|nr:hypothetical protein [Rhodospirillaceae bacterium]
MDSKHPTFEQLIAPITRAEFFADYYGKKPLYVPGSEKKFSSAFGWKDFDAMLDEGSYWSNAQLSLVVNGKALKPEEYSVQDNSAKATGAFRIDRGKLLDCLKQKPSMVLNYCQTQTPNIAALTATLESVFRCYVEMHIIASWEDHKGFASHFDYNDVLIFQTEGVKTWNIYEGRYDEPLKGTQHDRDFSMPQADELKGALLMQPQLNPGDFLYLPKGQFHDALAASEATLHLSYRLEHAVGMDYLKIIRSHLYQLPEFCEPLPHFDDTAAHDAHIEKLILALSKLLHEPSAIAFATNYQKITSTQDAFPSFVLPSSNPIIFFRVRHEALNESKNDITGHLDVLDWLKHREFFSLNEFETAFSNSDNGALLTRLEAQQLIEKRL